MKKFLAGAATAAIVLGVASAQAADIPRRQAMPAKAPAYVAQMYNWTGAYIGINGGWGWGSSSFDGAFPAGFDVDGALIGGTLGYNWQAGNVVFGLEGDLDWSDISGSGACAGTACSVRNNWLGTVRGRLGYAMDRFMPYVTGGLAVGDIDATIAGVGGSDRTKAGWTLGAGFEVAVAGPLTAKLEYLYVDLGNGGAIAGSTPDFTTNIVRAGLNYRF